MEIEASKKYKVTNGIVITEVDGCEVKEFMREHYFDAENIREVSEGLKDSITHDGDFKYLESAELYLLHRAVSGGREFWEKVATFWTHPDDENVNLS